jgi:hypothetical protein
MAGFKFSDFSAMFPIRDSRRLPDNAAALAKNMSPASGAIEAIRGPRYIKGLRADTRRVFRIPTGAYTDLSPASSFWWEFPDGNTDVLRTPVVNDSFERYYWCSPSTGLRFATKAQILAGSTGMPLGVQQPGSAPLALPIAGTGKIDPTTGKNSGIETTRAYLVTFVDEYGSEGQPSAPFEATGFADQDWQVSNIPQPVTQPGNPAIRSIRLYRTVTGSSGSTTFFRVVQLSPGMTVYTDRLKDTLVSGNPQLGTTNWDKPLAMDGIAMMAGGIMVGFKGNSIFFSEAYQPHAWPAAYSLTIQHQIIGLGVFGNSCVILTTGCPAVVSGTQPGTMTLNTSDNPMPCLSRRSIVSTPDGVFFASTDGLVVIGPGGIQPIADSIVGREIWQTAYAPETIQATLQYGHYCAMRTAGGVETGFMTPVTTSYQVTNPLPQSQTGITDIDGYAGSVVGMDAFSGKSWLITGNNLFEWLPADSPRLAVHWRSKELQIKQPVNMACAMLFFDRADDAPAGADTIRLRIWAGRRMVYDQNVSARNADVIKLPSGFKSEIWQVEVWGYCIVHEIQFASSVADLKAL